MLRVKNNKLASMVSPDHILKKTHNTCFKPKNMLFSAHWQKGKVFMTKTKKKEEEEIAARGKVKSKWEWRYVSGANWWEGREREGVSVGLLTGEGERREKKRADASL